MERGDVMSPTLLSTNDKITIKKWIKLVKKKKFKSSQESYSDAQKRLNFPYPEIGCGAHRIVFDLNNGYVLKVAVSKKGIKDNKIEAKVYHSVNPSLRKHFAPVIDHGRGWIIMEKFDRLFEMNEANFELCKKTLDKFSKEGITPHDIISKRDPNKINRSNLRFTKEGQLVIIDYGKFEIKE